MGAPGKLDYMFNHQATCEPVILDSRINCIETANKLLLISLIPFVENLHLPLTSYPITMFSYAQTN